MATPVAGGVDAKGICSRVVTIDHGRTSPGRCVIARIRPHAIFVKIKNHLWILQKKFTPAQPAGKWRVSPDGLSKAVSPTGHSQPEPGHHRPSTVGTDGARSRLAHLARSGSAAARESNHTTAWSIYTQSPLPPRRHRFPIRRPWPALVRVARRHLTRQKPGRLPAVGATVVIERLLAIVVVI